MSSEESTKLEQIAEDVREIKLAVKGDSSIGMTGLVEDVRELKSWRNSIDLRVASIGGGAAVLVMIAKYAFSLVK